MIYTSIIIIIIIIIIIVIIIIIITSTNEIEWEVMFSLCLLVY